MGPLGWQEMVIIFVIALVLFGPKKLPELGRNIGKAITEFRRASSDLRATFEREMQSIDKETQPIREAADNYRNQLYDSYYDSANPDYSAYNEESSTGWSSDSDQSQVGASATEGAESKPTETASIAVPEGETVPRGAAEPKTAANDAEPSRAG